MTSSHADSNMYISFFLARLHLQLEKDQKKNQKDNFTEKQEREIKVSEGNHCSNQSESMATITMGSQNLTINTVA